MTLTAKKKGDRCTVSIKGDMTIYTAALHKQELMGAMRGAKETDINLSKVNEFDSAGVQILMLAQREAKLAGMQLTLSAPSASAREVLDLYRLTSTFNIAAGKSSRSKR